jgi:hypothetical protein
MKKIMLSFVVIILFSVSYAQDASSWKFSGQVQLRTELDGRDFSNKTFPLTFSTIRTRFGVEKFVSEKVLFFAQLQDSRSLGQGTPTSFLSNVDLHQGYIKLINPFDWDLEVQAGRFQMVYGTERFFGASNWSHIARSFDGVRFALLPKKFDLDLFALTINDTQAPVPNAFPGAYNYPAKDVPSFSLYGFYKKSDLTEKSKLDVFGYYEVDRKDVKPDTNAINRFTIGTSYFGNYGNFSTIVEAAYQLGKISGADLSAYLISVSGSYKAGISTFTGGADIISGNDPKTPSKINAFNVGYGTNHKFYGYMDYFLASSGGLGLNDFYVKADIKPDNSKFNFAIDLHHFMSNQKALSGKSTFGQEIDLTVVYRFVPGTSITWGGSVFLPGELMKAIFAPREDVAFWSFVMITANF